ncbi:MAG: sulfite exporter TauE/SafE family protein [Candidatus Methylomirabilales bacterium]
MPFDYTTIIVAASLPVAAYVKGMTGMGFPTIATPMITMLLDIRTAVTILLIPNILMDLTQVFRRGSPMAVFRRFSWLLSMTVIGVFLGTKTLVMLPLWTLNLSLGIVVVAFVVSNLFRFNYQVSSPIERALSPMVGFVGGFLNGITNVPGPALAIYLYALQLPKTEFIKSIATIFIINKVSQLIAVSTWGLLTPSTLRLSLLVSVFVLLGFYLGLKSQDRVNQKTFNRVLLSLLFGIGVTLMVRALR